MATHYALVAPPKVRDVVISRDDRGNWELVNPEWPKRTRAIIAQMKREPFVKVWNGHLDIKLSNARAVYKILSTDVEKGYYTCELVYSEEPEVKR